MQVDIHDDLAAHFVNTVEAGFGHMELRSGLNGAGTLVMTQAEAKKLADAIYTNLGLTPL